MTAATTMQDDNPSMSRAGSRSTSEETPSPTWTTNGGAGGNEQSTSIPPGGPYSFQGYATTRRSRVRVWINLCARWLLTAAFIASVYAVLIAYSRHEVISTTQKRQFSALITGFLIALALLTLSHLLNIAVDLKWWILSRHSRSQRKVEAILRVNNISHTLRLAYKSKRPLIYLSVIVWILLFVGSQVGYAAIGLTYSIEKTEDVALMRPGNVTLANMDTVEPQRVVKYSSSVRAQRFSANSYGTMSLTLNQDTPDAVPRPGTLWFQDDPSFFCDDTSCIFVFKEANTDSYKNDDAIPVFVSSNRKVNVSSSCSSYRVTRGGNGTDPSFSIIAEGREVNISLPIQAGLGQSTFMTEIDNEEPDGVGSVSVLETSPTHPWYYNCTTTIGSVTNAVLPVHKLGANLTRLATTGIALQGYAGVTDIDGSTQAVVYPAASFFGVPVNGSAADMEQILSRFAVGIVAIASYANSATVIYGSAPYIGQRLYVEHWAIVHLIFALTAGLQLLLALSVVWLTHGLVVPPNHPVAEAQVLRSMMAAQERADRRALAGKRYTKSAWVYRAKYVGEGLYDLYMEAIMCAPNTGLTEKMQLPESGDSREQTLGLSEKAKNKAKCMCAPTGSSSDRAEDLFDYEPHILETINEEDTKEHTSRWK